MRECEFCGSQVHLPCRSFEDCTGCVLFEEPPKKAEWSCSLPDCLPNCTRQCSRKAPLPEAPRKRDDVYHPPHYARWKMEPIEFIAINDLPWWLANVIKYTMRFDAKDGLQDLYKARSYLEMKIRDLEGWPRFWDKPVSEERALKDGATERRTT